MPEKSSLHVRATRLVASRPTPVLGAQRPFSTFQSMVAIIDSSRFSLLLLVYALTEPARPLIERIADRASKGVKVTFCLDDHEGNVATLSRLWPANVESPRVLMPNRKRWAEGNMHAKVIISDTKSALITSANFTGWATDSNLEVGVLVEERLAKELHEYIMALVRSGAIEDRPLVCPR